MLCYLKCPKITKAASFEGRLVYHEITTIGTWISNTGIWAGLKSTFKKATGRKQVSYDS